MNCLAVLTPYPSLRTVAEAQLAAWPDHLAYLDQRFASPDDPTLAVCERMAAMILRLTGADLPLYCADYRWTCDNIMAEELYFRRHGVYRLNSFEDVAREIYGRPGYMERYVRGLLLSQILWANQAAAFAFYVDRFLPALPAGLEHLEIGPGHGLLLHFAAHLARPAGVTGWDISPSSLAATRTALERMGTPAGTVRLEEVNILDPVGDPRRFGSVVLSEVLEHVDDPARVLDTVFAITRPGGRVYLNVPCNSPAPDHITLWRTPEEVVTLVQARGFRVIEAACAPATGYDEGRARRRGTTLNSLIIAERP